MFSSSVHQVIDQAIEVNAMNYRSPAHLKNTMAFIFSFFSRSVPGGKLVIYKARDSNRHLFVCVYLDDEI